MIFLKEQKSILKEITFPKVEWKELKKKLEDGEELSSVRNSCGKEKKVFKVGERYTTQWGVEVIISKIEYFDDPKKIPTWEKMNKTMQKSILYGVKMCGASNLAWIHLK